MSDTILKIISNDFYTIDVIIYCKLYIVYRVHDDDNFSVQDHDISDAVETTVKNLLLPMTLPDSGERPVKEG